jgi:hypothetical protein
MDAQAIISAVEGVTKKWCRQRKAEERESSRRFRRRQAMLRSQRVTIRDVAFEKMEDFYLAASTDGKYPAHARQIFYRARGPVQEATGRTLDDQYFTQTLLLDYLTENPETTRIWDVVFDARGHFTEPHTELIVPLGTLDVRKYLGNRQHDDASSNLLRTKALFPTHGPRHRFSAILFIEKEGFMPLFKAVRLAERFDIAVMSTKGMSVTASRQLVDRLCAEYGLPLLVLHDFDKSGFSIAGTLQRDTRRYSFESAIRVIDLGLRLKDVQKWRLVSEEVSYGKSDPTGNREENGATDDEIAFLCDEERSRWDRYVGRRVELNAFSSGDLIAWVEDGLGRHGVRKVLPDAETLEAAFRRAAANAILAEQLPRIVEGARAQADGLKLPASLEREIKAQLQADPAQPWDRVIAAVAERVVRTDDAGEGA